MTAKPDVTNSEHLHTSDATSSHKAALKIFELTDYMTVWEPEPLPIMPSPKMDGTAVSHTTPPASSNYVLSPKDTNPNSEEDRLRARVAELEAERDNWRVSSVCRELSKDKERLDWLDRNISERQCAELFGRIWACGELRAAIDAAKESSPNPAENAHGAAQGLRDIPASTSAD